MSQESDELILRAQARLLEDEARVRESRVNRDHRVYYALKDGGYSVRSLAKLLGVSRQAIMKMRDGYVTKIGL